MYAQTKTHAHTHTISYIHTYTHTYIHTYIHTGTKQTSHVCFAALQVQILLHTGVDNTHTHTHTHTHQYELMGKWHAFLTFGTH